ncbi:uncharacterized protein [Nicotiana tomentosiformis]|uniref:uncharacterized protein n=1 Tax=Nicotiana tomentosiformis TaxID=4098 RepID=UPI00388C9B3E
MFAIFTDMVEDIMEVFMDDFSVMGDSFEDCLHNLRRVLKRCIETNLVPNWEKCHFMVQEGIVLGHRVSKLAFEEIKKRLVLDSKEGVKATLNPLGSFSTRIRSRNPWQKRDGQSSGRPPLKVRRS